MEENNVSLELIANSYTLSLFVLVGKWVYSNFGLLAQLEELLHHLEEGYG